LDPGASLHQGVVTRLLAIGPARAEGGERCVDQFGFVLRNSDSLKPIWSAFPPRKFSTNTSTSRASCSTSATALGLREVDGDGSLAAVDGSEIRAPFFGGVFRKRRHMTRLVARTGPLDLDYVGPQRGRES
jgi:hypothetical protein